MIDVKDYPLEQKLFADMWNLFKAYAELDILGEFDSMNLLNKTNELSKQYINTRAEPLFKDMSLAVIDHIARLNR